MGCGASGPELKRGTIYNDLGNDVIISIYQEGRDVGATGSDDKGCNYSDVVVKYNELVFFRYYYNKNKNVGAPDLILTMSIPELGYSIELKAQLETFLMSTSNFCGFLDKGNSVSEIVKYKEYISVYPKVTKLTVNNVVIEDIPAYYNSMKIVNSKINSWIAYVKYAKKRHLSQRPEEGVCTAQKGGISDKTGKSLKIASLVLDIASSFDPTGISSAAKQVVEHASSANEVYRDIAGKGKDDGNLHSSSGKVNFCPNCGTAANGKFCTNCGKQLN